MRKFQYFLYDNYDPSITENRADDPRFILGENSDVVLSAIVEARNGLCQYKDLCQEFHNEPVEGLLHIGLLRREGQSISRMYLYSLRRISPVYKTVFQSISRKWFI